MKFQAHIFALLLLVGCASPQHSEQVVASSASRSIDSFRFIGPTTTMQQVFAAVGREDRDLGSGLAIYEYRLEDGSYIWIGTTSMSHIVYVRHGKTLDDSVVLYPKP